MISTRSKHYKLKFYKKIKKKKIELKHNISFGLFLNLQPKTNYSEK